MLKLRKILLCSYLYYFFLIIVILISLLRLAYPKTSLYNENSTSLIGRVIAVSINNQTLKLTIKNKEKILVYYYLKESSNYQQIQLGDTVKVIGTFQKPPSNTTRNLFNYQKYLYNKDIHYTVQATSLIITNRNNNIYYFLKQKIKERARISPYLEAFILGDKSSILKEAKTSYQENGISHLLAISGMHISLFSQIILKILKRLNISERKRYFFTSLFLILYLSILDLSPSALRGVLFFILFTINKVYYFYIKPQYIFLVVLSLTILINPYFIYDVGFQYSFIISITLILTSPLIAGSYLLELLKTSTISFFVSIPISLYNYHQINILSIIYNLFYVPLVSLIIFPLSLITIFFPFLLPIYNFFVQILEKSSLFLTDINFGKLIFPRLNIFLYLIYYLLIIIVFLKIKKSKKPLIIFLIIILIHYNYPAINRATLVTMIDVGQGDSLLLHTKESTILIDTGGKESFVRNDNSSNIVLSTIIPYLKSLGIRSLDYLILTHGDYDHMGEAINLVNSFKVDKVIFNCGEYNHLEKELIKVLDKKHIQHYSCIKELNISENKLYFLQTKEYDNENDNSNVIYTELNGYKFMFMGDAGVEKEKDILEKYNLNNIDVLKVGHHGSKTSSSPNFINSINPKYALISVGKDNKFNHPNTTVLNTLSLSKILRTDIDGSVEIILTKNNYVINTCPP